MKLEDKAHGFPLQQFVFDRKRPSRLLGRGLGLEATSLGLKTPSATGGLEATACWGSRSTASQGVGRFLNDETLSTMPGT